MRICVLAQLVLKTTVTGNLCHFFLLTKSWTFLNFWAKISVVSYKILLQKSDGEGTYLFPYQQRWMGTESRIDTIQKSLQCTVLLNVFFRRSFWSLLSVSLNITKGSAVSQTWDRGQPEYIEPCRFLMQCSKFLLRLSENLEKLRKDRFNVQ